MAQSLKLGGDGLVPGLGNVVPGVFAALIRAARAGDEAETARLQQQIDALGTLHQVGHWLPALKTACAHVGGITWESAYPSPPLERPDPEQRAAIQEIVRRHA
jgi:dihydrodipicolinate synthase/N-acetylneuraminate lyase